jgi:pimeloyl-ACP methyl ester carboxylesterase
LWPLDWLSLRLSPVYFGLGVPRGDGGPVVLVPGFMTADVYMAEMYFWLRRIGYDPFLSGVGLNAGCIHESTQRLENTVDEIYRKTGRPVRIVGHSLGGILARRVALRRPDIVSQLISLGSPIQSLEAHPLLMATAALFQGRVEHPAPGEDTPGGPDIYFGDRCECETDHCVLAPASSVRRAALYSRSDGVIRWRNCLEPDTPANYDVGGTHIGLAFNARGYRVIANLLAESADMDRRLAA